MIFRYLHYPKPEVPAHIKLLDWIPQNDILAHPKMKLFITHCGGNSQFEALYHAVPMLNFPFFADQPYNAKRADYKGYSKTLTMDGLNSSFLVDNIQEMINNDAYAKTIELGSRIFRDRQMHPKELAVHSIEHILKFGGDHLHSYALDMPWYKYLMLDILTVILVLLAVVMISLMLVVYLCVKLVSMLCQSKGKLKKH